VRRAGTLTTFLCRLSWNLGASTTWNPQGLSRPVMGLLYLLSVSSVRTTATGWQLNCSNSNNNNNNNNNTSIYYPRLASPQTIYMWYPQLHTLPVAIDPQNCFVRGFKTQNGENLAGWLSSCNPSVKQDSSYFLRITAKGDFNRLRVLFFYKRGEWLNPPLPVTF
jgi:hypothetical protein